MGFFQSILAFFGYSPRPEWKDEGKPMRDRVLAFVRANQEKGVNVRQVAYEFCIWEAHAQGHLDALREQGYLDALPHSATGVACPDRTRYACVN